jgi:endonuclease-8
MPEGDSIFRTARTLHSALAGYEVMRFESVLPALTRVHEDTPITGRTIESVTAAGKHVLMRFSGDLILRTHMRMNGSWHLYRLDERWRRPRRDMRVLVATRAFQAVGFSVPVAEFLDSSALRRQLDLRLLGPDLLQPDFDAHEALRRFREHQTSSIADALINQRVVAGAGNVYKSEVLFLCGVNPFVTVSAVTDADLERILQTARKHLKANVDHPTGGIVTYRGYRRSSSRPSEADRLYVYGRAGLPCRTCGTPIEVTPQGPNARLTYWCPSCQKKLGQP